MGPGDPELVTLKAVRILAGAPVVAFFAKRGQRGHARAAADGLLARDVTELRLDYPFTVEIAHDHPDYVAAIRFFYDEAAARIEAQLAARKDVALLCEGDAFLYGSAMYVFDRLRMRHACRIVPGVAGMAGAWSAAQAPIAQGDDVLTVIPGTLDADRLRLVLSGSDAAVIMKVGRNIGKIRAALALAGREDAVYVERATMAGERTLKLGEVGEGPAPYFSMVLVPGRRRAR
jgi:precorrin-2/cobalt-factor-2 C20-methyltransferase